MDHEQRAGLVAEIRALRVSATHSRERSERPERNERERALSLAAAQKIEAQADELQAELDALPPL